MPEQNGGRQKNVTGAGNGVHKRGDGLGTGSVGSGSGMPGASGPSGPSGPRPSSGSGYSSGSGTTRAGGGGMLKIIIIVAILLIGGGGGLFSLFGGSDDGGSTSSNNSSSVGDSASSLVGNLLGGGSSGGLNLGSLAGSLIGSGFGSSTYQTVSGTSSNWVSSKNTGTLNTKVSSEARSKYTTIKGSGKDTVTIMVYMCGTDLESKHGMATNDLNEMMRATISDKINIIVYTGGCSRWKTNGISSTNNQIYKVTSGKMTCLENNIGNKAMTEPSTLTEFIKYGQKNYSADRMMLIFWDHGGGSLSGYGYDETHKTASSMNLAGIDKALKDAGIKYDFVGFDACLMATVETDLMLAKYADYVISSEETEPGVGWYYTNWLTKLSNNTSMATTEIGKNIIDDFVDECNRTCPGQETTLSLVDLAELSSTVSDEFKAFSQSTTQLIKEDHYETVSDARSDAREFCTSSPIDQIDLINFALNMNTEEGKALADTLLSAVKYNRTSSNMTNAYGISIYFPYRKTNQSKINSATQTYDQIGLDDEYSACIKEFAGVQGAGQSVGSSGSSSLISLLGGGTTSGSDQTFDAIFGLISSLTGTSGRAMSSMSDNEIADYLSNNMLDASKLRWSKDLDGRKYIALTANDWKLIQQVDLNVFVDDGEGYIDLGLDNLYGIDDYGNLIADTDGTWLSLNNQPVAFYHTDTTGDTLKGRIPAMLNGERVNIIVAIDVNTGKGSVLGAEPVYDASVTETEFRGLIDIVDGDKIDFLCDYYKYDGTYSDSYYLGEQMTVKGEIVVSDTLIGSKYIGMYKFTDIYGQEYWSERFE
ncbi:MAG: peptidase C11 [Lachnospiraceae bacterium]|nr:peptidase C11 [Lachnospiraceae bacterium]